MKARTLARTASLVALSVALLLVPSAALANGAPVKIVLGYQEGLSNWGPRGAGGVADITVGEGIVQITAAGLTRLDGQLYEGWLINTRTNERFATGRFNAEADGTVRYERVFDHIPDHHYDLFVLSLVGSDQETNEPTAQISIAGYFPVLQAVSPNLRPAELPYTGAEIGLLPLAVGLLLLGGALGYGLHALLPVGRRGP